MIWCDQPNSPGWWWYRANEQSKDNFRARTHQLPHVVKTREMTILRVVTDHTQGVREGRLIVRFAAGSVIDVKALAGRWAGPLQQPEE